MQANLKSLLGGKREVVVGPPKRGPGRPPKLRERDEEVDVGGWGHSTWSLCHVIVRDVGS